MSSMRQGNTTRKIAWPDENWGMDFSQEQTVSSWKQKYVSVIGHLDDYFPFSPKKPNLHKS